LFYSIGPFLHPPPGDLSQHQVQQPVHMLRAKVLLLMMAQILAFKIASLLVGEALPR